MIILKNKHNKLYVKNGKEDTELKSEAKRFENLQKAKKFLKNIDQSISDYEVVEGAD